MLPCQLDLALHLICVVGETPCGFQSCKEGSFGTICCPPALGRRVGCGCTENLGGRHLGLTDTLTCKHLHVETLRAPQVLCLSAAVLSPVPRRRKEGKVTHISRVRSEQAHLNLSGLSASLG